MLSTWCRRTVRQHHASLSSLQQLCGNHLETLGDQVRPMEATKSQRNAKETTQVHARAARHKPALLHVDNETWGQEGVCVRIRLC